MERESAATLPHVGTDYAEHDGVDGGGAEQGVHPVAPPLFAARFRPLLARASLSYWVALTVVIALLPTLRTGFVWDDLFHRLAVQGGAGLHRGPLDLFDFIPGDPVQRRSMLEHGIGGWWLGSQTQIAYFRPLASLTHYLDYSRWPDAPWLMHLESVLWYGGAVVACGAFYRRFIDVGWMVGLATFLYAFDHAHAGPVAWIANRSALMATLFGVLCVVAHDLWRRERRRGCAPLAWALFAISLLSAESGMAIGGYLVAHALCVDRARPARRLLSLVPYAVIAGVWRVVYAALGYGVLGCGINSDPLRAPLGFVARALQTVPLLVASEIVTLPPDALIVAPWVMRCATVVAIAVVGAFALACWPLLRKDRTSLFFALGALLSTLPFGGVMATGRYLFWTGLGVMGLLARIAGASARTLPSRPARAFCLACLSGRFFLSTLLFPAAALGPSIWRSQMTRLVATFPSGPQAAHQTVVLMSAPNDLVAGYVPITSAGNGGTLPAHVYPLHAGMAELRVLRSGPRSIEVTAPRGWMPGPLDRSLRSTPFEVGEHVALDGMDAAVLSVTADGRADVVRFSFPVDLEDRSLAFLSWGRHGLEPFSLPPLAGGIATVPAPPMVVR